VSLVLRREGVVSTDLVYRLQAGGVIALHADLKGGRVDDGDAASSPLTASNTPLISSTRLMA